jgi:hypothetical protein
VTPGVTYAVALDSGAHLAPGHVAEVEETPRVSRQIADGLLRVLPAKPEAQIPGLTERNAKTEEASS